MSDTNNTVIVKQYTSKDVVLATPMSRGDYNKYRGWDLPSDENGDDPGYLTEQVDTGGGDFPNVDGHVGYVCWKPKESFMATYLPSDTWYNRVAIEAKELSVRIADLKAALSGELVPKDSVTILTEQLELMEKLFVVLQKRLVASNQE